MQLFIDTAEIEEIKSLNITGLIDGVTTNPSLIAKSGRNIISTNNVLKNAIWNGWLSSAATLMRQCMDAANIPDTIINKIAITESGKLLIDFRIIFIIMDI